ncbi:hypothetical protein BCR44DRAFT_60063 [Catenaria anguillulae PL171]|uniref:Myb/SANT-like domain-containing protein n=1 Tax=Catenaria anguillulae PL171 TaxID=765915 RepID=A0A1Y2HUR8_9FUNG|nr:hypothetical protein BCR44DRAFT_60063 [Catenaria anguillulae PL171]
MSSLPWSPSNASAPSAMVTTRPRRSAPKIAADVTAATGEHVNETQVKNHVDTMKSTFRAIERCLAKSGWGFDDIAKCATAPDEVFYAALALDKSIKLVRRPFAVYDECKELYQSVTATGSHAITISEIANGGEHPDDQSQSSRDDKDDDSAFR